MEQTKISNHCRVTLHFAIALENGQIADATEDDTPIAFEIGDGTFKECLELTLYGLKAGDTQSVLIDPREGFGPRDETLIQMVKKSSIDIDETLKKGLVMEFEQEGNVALGTIMEIKDEFVIIDFNHPLAGHAFLFQVEIIEVEALKERLH